MPQDQDLIAKFLAEKGATRIAPAPAYGVDREADRAKRAAERDRLAAAEQAHDARREAAHDAFFVGDRDEGFRLLSTRWESV